MAETIEVTLLPQEYEKLAAVAAAQQLSVAEAAEIAVKEWLDGQRRLEYARSLMRALGHGLGQGAAPNDKARHHDAYLYGRQRP
jgi:hypothetical protein